MRTFQMPVPYRSEQAPGARPVTRSQSTNVWIRDEVQGTAVDKQGRLFVVTDNDGLEDASGDARSIRIGNATLRSEVFQASADRLNRL